MLISLGNLPVPARINAIRILWHMFVQGIKSQFREHGPYFMKAYNPKRSVICALRLSIRQKTL